MIPRTPESIDAAVSAYQGIVDYMNMTPCDITPEDLRTLLEARVLTEEMLKKLSTLGTQWDHAKFMELVSESTRLTGAESTGDTNGN